MATLPRTPRAVAAAAVLALGLAVAGCSEPNKDQLENQENRVDINQTTLRPVAPGPESSAPVVVELPGPSTNPSQSDTASPGLPVPSASASP